MNMTEMADNRSRQDEELVAKAVTILMRELGSVDASRFLAMPPRQRMESVRRHHDWQAGLDQPDFFDDVFGESAHGSR